MRTKKVTHLRLNHRHFVLIRLPCFWRRVRRKAVRAIEYTLGKCKMKNYRLSFTFIIFLILSTEGCNPTEPEDSSEFEAGYYFTTTTGNLPLYRSKSIIAVEFESSVTSEEAKSIIQSYNLEPIKMFENTTYRNDWEKGRHW